MYATTYHRPASLAEASALLANADEAKILAGGMTLLPTMKNRLAAPSDLVDVGRLAELAGVSLAGDTLTIGAATKHYEVAGSATVKGAIPALAKLAGGIGDPQVRHMGTIGGSISNNDPAADYPAGLVGLGATVTTSKRTLAAEDFFAGLFSTVLDAGEIVTKVSFPVPAKAAYAKFPNPASRYAMAGVMVVKARDGSVRVAVTGAGGNGVFRWHAAEAALAASFSAAALDGLSVDAGDLMSDIHGSSEYRANLVKVMTQRAVAAAG
ncbi:MAG: xanthine dehydrogenase family protein subunit M [Hyphomicrobiaceae bacterium]|nr:xanthine dehydrogenase family protein subunit M [Hyphomicrobiaceae bacterium]